MSKSKFFKIIIILCLYFIVYLTAMINQSDFWGDILAPIGGLLSSGIIIYCYFKMDPAKKMRRNWILLSMGCLSWTVADILWAIDEWILHLNAESSDLIAVFYAGTNIFLLTVVVIQEIHDFKTWNAMQLLVDSFAVSASSLFFLWIIFFNKSFFTFELTSLDGWVTVVSIISDVAALVGITVWYCSIHSGRIPLYLHFIALSVLFYFIVDLYWYYLYLSGRYVVNSVIDAAYMAALLGSAVGAMVCIAFPYKLDEQIYNYSNVGMRQTSLFLLVCPAMIILFGKFAWLDLFHYLIIIVCYGALTIYIQTGIKEHNYNAELEKRITERTKELVEMNERLDRLSNQDTVTNLNNRRCFIHQLESKITSISSNETIALLFIDLDRFKTINDTYGHDMGDQVLIEVAKRLQRVERENMFLARFGGDEFVLAVHGSYTYKDIEEIAQQIVNECSKAIQIDWYSFYITLSVGISIYPLDASDVNSLMRNADIAMYQAKKMGYNRIVSSNLELDDTIKRKNEIEILLKNVDFDREFILFYQPQFNISNKGLIGMEALVRWNNPQKGFIPPNKFIPIAEETDDIILIGNWVMKKAVAQIANWNRTYHLKLKMAINVSPKQLDQTDFFTYLQSLMRDYSVKPEWIDAEITEGVAMKGNAHMSEICQKFKHTGVTVSIDDFGTGYSSLSYLKLFPFDRIKIDKSLIDEITTDPYDQNIVKFTTLLAKSIGVKTLAEGVETQEQYDLLASLGCEQIQGYFLGRPISSSEFEKQLLQTKDIGRNEND